MWTLTGIILLPTLAALLLLSGEFGDESDPPPLMTV